MLQRTLGPAGRSGEPDWTGFWPGVVRGIEAGGRQPRIETSRRVWLRPRWALGGALVAAFLVSATFWQTQAPPALADPVIVSAADTEHPQGSVMIYHTPDRGVTVVWVFGVDDDDD